jgi:hypothetical protein
MAFRFGRNFPQRKKHRVELINLNFINFLLFIKLPGVKKKRKRNEERPRKKEASATLGSTGLDVRGCSLTLLLCLA